MKLLLQTYPFFFHSQLLGAGYSSGGTPSGAEADAKKLNERVALGELKNFFIRTYHGALLAPAVGSLHSQVWRRPLSQGLRWLLRPQMLPDCQGSCRNSTRETNLLFFMFSSHHIAIRVAVS